MPNILFIFSDDHAVRTISAYAGKNGINQTPNIDRIANEGAVFTRSFCGNSICQPSRASILTGKHSHKNGVLSNGSRWDNQQQIFTRLLSAGGYQTAMIGKWHMHPTPSTEFDYHCTLTGNGGQGRYYNPEFINHDGKTETVMGYSTDVITSKSIAWLEGRDKSKPFMLMTQFKSPHTNVMPALRHLDKYKDVTFPAPASYHSDNKGRIDYLDHTWMKMHGMKAPDVLKTGPAKGTYSLAVENKASQRTRKNHKTSNLPKYYSYMTPKQLDAWHAHYDPINAEYGRRLAAGMVSEEEQAEFPYQRYLKDYLRCVHAVDENVGRLLKYLDDKGLTENTIVIYSSDQGFFLGENGWTDKRLMDEVTMQMPFIIRWPKVIKASQRIDSMIQNIDYAPTFLEIAGLKVPKDIQGRSLLPILKGKTPSDWRTSLYYSYHQAGAYNLPRIEGVRGERYKLIRYYDHPKLKLGEQWELFDLENDPAEQNSLAKDPEYAEVIQTMRKELKTLREQYGVEGVSNQ
ncbi:sulfatase family protein [Oceaniferula marina]|nr:sulfatase [Oceaniferula marina]